MDVREAAQILAMVAGVDHRVPPLAKDGPDERVPVWHTVLGDLDYQTAQQGVITLARDPGLVAIRPGDVYQAAKRVMRRNLARVDASAIEPPDDMDTRQTLAWRRALTRAIGRGAPADQAAAEADQAVGVTHGPELEGPKRRGLPRIRRNLAELTAGPTRTPARIDAPQRDEIRAELAAIRRAAEARRLDASQETPEALS